MTNITSIVRRAFLGRAAGALAATGTVLALATIPPARVVASPASPPDPVFGLIEAHRTEQAAHLVALAEQGRLERIGDRSFDAEWECHAAMDAFNELIGTAPTTFAGLQAWVSYLGEIRDVEEWMFEEEGSALVVTLVEALGNLAEQSGS